MKKQITMMLDEELINAAKARKRKVGVPVSETINRGLMAWLKHCNEMEGKQQDKQPDG